MESRVHFAICHYCGQTMMIESTEEMTEEKLRERAIYACKCPQAVKEREFIEFDKQFAELLGDGAEESGFMASKKTFMTS